MSTHPSFPDLNPTRVTINLAHLRHNARVLQAQAGPAPMMAVLKADAYGHGAVQVARALSNVGVRYFAVATVPEALRLREAGIEAPILVFAAPLVEYLPAYFAHNLEVNVPSQEVAEAVIDLARTHGPIRVHVKIETGMGRVGLMPADAPAAIRHLAAAPNVTIAGLWTHFAMATEPGGTFARHQLALFESVLREVDANATIIHAASSSALLNVPSSVENFSHTLVRAGIALYGHTRPGVSTSLDLRPVMRFTSRITHLKVVEPGTTISYGRTWMAERRSRIATVAAGYADGYTRLLSNRSEVRIRGRRYSAVGTICMDMFMVNLGAPDGPGAAIQVGDEVVLFDGDGPTASEVAVWAETIPYEICCRISARVPRFYIDDPEAP